MENQDFKKFIEDNKAKYRDFFDEQIGEEEWNGWQLSETSFCHVAYMRETERELEEMKEMNGIYYSTHTARFEGKNYFFYAIYDSVY